MNIIRSKKVIKDITCFLVQLQVLQFEIEVPRSLASICRITYK
jgi:hypothetical protein